PERERKFSAGAQFKECSSCPEMVALPLGSFTMGSPAGEGDAEERPAHNVVIAQRFAISKYPITFEQWEVCVAFGGCKNPASSGAWERGARPAINISWDDAQEYVTWLSRLTKRPYRLASEAEWEYAARAYQSTRSAFGYDETDLGDHRC